MSQNLTQPEEIDQALMAMPNHDSGPKTPIPEGAQPGETLRHSKRDKSPHDSANPIPYVWSM